MDRVTYFNNQFSRLCDHHYFVIECLSIIASILNNNNELTNPKVLEKCHRHAMTANHQSVSRTMVFYFLLCASINRQNDWIEHESNINRLMTMQREIIPKGNTFHVMDLVYTWIPSHWNDFNRFFILLSYFFSSFFSFRNAFVSTNDEPHTHLHSC